MRARSILISGGTGSFGRAFARHCLDEGVERVCIFSRGEHAQASMREAFGNDQRLRFFIGDVRDRDRLRRAMTGCDLVIHAAALKRIEVGHWNPVEMCRTNIDGAINVIEAAQDAYVDRVVALSTDKAYQPISPYGQSKALAEALFLNANNTIGAAGPRFSVCRYGNVAGSAGSVIPKWREQLARTERIQLTDPECTRFWMTMREAIGLVAGTTDTMIGGELAIPDLPACRLLDLAVAMGVTAGVEIVGLQPWEKRHESMCEGKSSEHARRMSVDELREALKHV